MPFTLTMPKLSPTMEEGTIVKWHVKEGDKVEAGAVLMEVATDKATVEHSALDEGYIRQILVKEGSSATVNQAIAIFTETADESIEGYKPEGEATPEPAAQETPQEGEAPKQEAKPAPTAGMVEPAFVPEEPLEDYQYTFSSDAKDYFPASPLAKKLAKEKGIDLSSVKGSGPNGKVMSRDLDLGQPDSVANFSKRKMPEVKPGTYEEIPLSPMRKVIGKRLQESKTFIPHFYIHQDIDVTSLVSLREELKTHGLKVTFNDFVVRATALALKKHPNINAGYNSVTQSQILFKTIDISIAVTMEGGLITPIVRYADFKNLGEISSEVKHLAKKAKEGALEPTEYKGGSFTISNLGMFGVSDFVAVINPPQAAILAVAGIDEKPVYIEGEIVPRKIMRVTLSFDHRVIDGAEGALFTKDLKALLENPSILLV